MAEKNETSLSVADQEKVLKEHFPTLTGFIYYSDPDTVEKIWHHKVVPTFNHEEKELLPYMLHAKRPSDDLKDGIWSVSSQDWVENSKDGQAELIAKQNKQIQSLTANNQEKQEQIDKLQESISQSSQTTSQLAQQFNSFGTQVTQSLTKVTEAVNKLTEKEGDK